MLEVLGSLLIERLRSQITRTKTPVLAIIFELSMPIVRP
jgi:hypothetical protein